MFKSKIEIAMPLAIFMAIAATCIGSNDPILTLCIGFVGALFVGTLWHAGTAPIIVLPIITQFAQIATPRIYANLLGVPIEDVSLHIGDLTSATWFALAGLASLVIGLHISQRGFQGPIVALHREAKMLSPRATFVFCCCMIALAAVFERLAELYDGLTQAMLAASRIQWMGVFMLTCVCFAQRQGKFKYLLPIVAIEVIKGFTGFFGDFRLVFFVVLVGIASAGPKLRTGTAFAGVIAGLALVVISAWWSAIKVDYRDYVNRGTGQQVVLVSVEDRLLFLMDRLYNVSLDTMGDGFDRLVRRLGYVDFLAATMSNVPARVPHENGAQIGESILHVLQPRFLFPDKPPVPNDTEVAERVTGIPFSRTTRSTSISLGYLAELYMDFGVVGALLAMLILGLAIGGAFRLIIKQNSVPAMAVYGCSAIVALTITEFGEALIKVIGGFVTALAVSLVLVWFVLPPLLNIFGLLPSFRPRLQSSSQ